MAKSPGQKQKLLYLAKIFSESSDESHALTISELIELLGGYGVHAERKTLYADIEALRTFGMDIVMCKTDRTRYYLGSREFELAELKLLVDAIQSSRFITRKKSGELIQKLGRLTSSHNASLLIRNIYVSGRSKSHNESVYYNIDALHTAVSSNRKITFRYFTWSLDFNSPSRITRLYRRGGVRYRVSPWALIWDSEYYYLVAYDDLHSEIRHYRVDRMTNISLSDLPRDGKEEYGAIDISTYSQKVFSMFAGKEETVKIRFANRLIGVVTDRYGKDVFISPGDDGFFHATIEVAVSQQFYAWIFGFGSEARIISPSYMAEELRLKAQQVFQLYPEST